MGKHSHTYSDNEYIIMTEIMKKENISQRKLAKKLGVSVSTVNVLVNKMIKEGIIKMSQVSQKQVLYMLTPEGIAEKAQKTVSYLKIHYKTIFQTKEKIKETIEELSVNHDVIFVLMSNDEIGEIVEIAIGELDLSNLDSILKVVNTKEEININEFESPITVYMSADKEVLKDLTEIEGLSVTNLTDKLVI